MAGKDIFKMSMKELSRIPVIYSVINGQITQQEAANLLGLCRQPTIEGGISVVINKIIRGNSLTQKEKGLFAIFVAMMVARTPNTRRNIEYAYAQLHKHRLINLASSQKAFETIIKGYEKKTGRRIPVSSEELRQQAKNFDENFKISTEPLASLQMIIPLMANLTNIFFSMRWIFIRATNENEFLTGDNPVLYGDPTQEKSPLYPSGLANKNIQVTLPLSQGLAAVGSWQLKYDLKYAQGSNQDIKGINKNTVVATYRFVYASKKSDVLLRFVKKYKDTAPKLKIY